MAITQPGSLPGVPGAWRRISLRMMFVVITLIACYLGYHANNVHARRRMRYEFGENPAVSLAYNYHGDRKTPATIPWIRQLMGDFPIQFIYYHRYAGPISPDVEERLRQTFPEAEVGEVHRIPLDIELSPSVRILDER